MRLEGDNMIDTIIHIRTRITEAINPQGSAINREPLHLTGAICTSKLTLTNIPEMHLMRHDIGNL